MSELYSGCQLTVDEVSRLYGFCETVPNLRAIESAPIGYNLGMKRWRWLFVLTAVIAVLVGGYLGWANMAAEADRQAVISAIRAGRVDLESERQYIGEQEYEKLKAELHR